MLISQLSLGLTLPRSGGGSGGVIERGLVLAPFWIDDGETWQDQPFYAQYTDPNRVLILPEGYTRTSFTVTLTQDDADTPIGPVVVSGSSVVAHGDLLVMRIQATASKAGAPDLSCDWRVEGMGVHVAPVATAGTHEVDLTQGGETLFVPWAVLFEPSVAGRELGDIVGAVTGAPVGVSVLATGLLFDPTVLEVQMGTPFTVVGENSNATPSGPKTILLSVAFNVVVMTEPLTLAQGYAGGQLLELTNRAAALDLSNWSGSAPSDYVIFSAFEDGVPVDPLATTARLKVGSEYQAIAALWAAGTGPGLGGEARLTVVSNVMVVADWLSVVDVSADGVQWRLEIDEAVPDALVVRGLVVDGREVNSGVTVGQLREAGLALLETHVAPAPSYPSGAAIGATMQLFEPVVVGPATADITRRTDVLRDGTLVASDVAGSRVLVAGDDGAYLQTRATDSAAGLVDLVTVSSPTPVVLAGPVYTPRRFSSDGSTNLIGNVSPNQTGLLFAGALERAVAPSNYVLNINNGSGSHIRPFDNGGVVIKMYDSAGSLIYDAVCLELYDATGLSHVVYKFGFTATNSVLQIVKNGLDVSNTITVNLDELGTGLIQSGDMGILGRRFGSFEYVGQFEDVVVQVGTTTDALAFYGANSVEIGADYIIGGPTQRAVALDAPEAPNINTGQHSGTAPDVSFTNTVALGAEPFSEVV